MLLNSQNHFCRSLWILAGNSSSHFLPCLMTARRRLWNRIANGVIIPKGSKSEAAIDKSCLCCNRSIFMSKMGFLIMKVSFLKSHFCPKTRWVNSVSLTFLPIKGKLESFLKNFVMLKPLFLVVLWWMLSVRLLLLLYGNSVKSRPCKNFSLLIDWLRVIRGDYPWHIFEVHRQHTRASKLHQIWVACICILFRCCFCTIETLMRLDLLSLLLFA